MRNETTSAATRTLNTIMMWLFCLTVIMLIIPWQSVSAEIAGHINSNRIMLYFALIIEISNFIAQAISHVFNSITQKNYNRRLIERISKAVEELDFAEKALLREYVLQRRSVLTLPVLEPTVRNLIDEGVLKIVNVVDNEEKTADIIISKEARPYITYKAIGLTLGKMTEDQVNQIMSSRPDYARQKKVVQQNRVFVGSRSVNQLYRSPAAEEKEDENTVANTAA
ncbi:MAG: super-infection exclusion protein B [Succinivibrio sp.]